ncbi:MAG: hypothetical protein Q4C64_07750 [Erysipelotrichia bacterium]|nr:hypothetical protein [Erysipelotrichia bacterium]
MKFLKKTLCSLLAITVAFSFVYSVSFSAFAANDSSVTEVFTKTINNTSDYTKINYFLFKPEKTDNYKFSVSCSSSTDTASVLIGVYDSENADFAKDNYGNYLIVLDFNNVNYASEIANFDKNNTYLIKTTVPSKSDLTIYASVKNNNAGETTTKPSTTTDTTKKNEVNQPETKPSQTQITNNSSPSSEKLSIKKLSSKKKSLVVYWNKITDVSGYQVQVATDKKFKKNKKTVTVSNQNTCAKTVKNLKSKKKYYARVRAYKIFNGKKYYGSWSKVKSVKTK